MNSHFPTVVCSRGKRHARRWYEAPETNQKAAVGRELWAGFDAKMPSEWESWLRHRREATPTDDQVMASIALADMKKRNAAKLEIEREKEFIAEVTYFPGKKNSN